MNSLDSEKIYRAIGESINYGVWICTPDGRNIYASDSFLRLVGLTQEECSDFGWGSVLHPDDAERTISTWQECVRSEGVWDIEHRFRGVDGQWHPILARGVPVRNDKGELIVWAGINLDISGIKQAETAIRSSEERMQLALDAAHLATWDWDITSGAIIWNDEHFRMLGYEPGNFPPTYQHWADRVHPDDLPATEARIQQTIQCGDDYRSEFRVVLPDGTVRTLEALGRIERNQAGLAIRLHGAMRDITEQKQVMDELRRAKDDLEERIAERTADLQKLSDYNRSLIEASLDPLVTIDVDGKIADVNSATELVTGYQRQELIGTDFSDYFTDPDRAREGYKLVFKEGQVRDYPLEISHNDGTITPVLYNASVYRDNVGNISGVFAAARDISKRKQAEIEREQFYKFFLTSADIMAIADPDGAFLKTNPACSELLGYTEEELVSKPFIDFVYADDRQATLDEMVRQQQIGYTLSFENRYVCKDGSFRWLSWRAVYNSSDKCTYATARDITENKQQEESLRNSEEEFRQLAEAMPQIVWITRADGWNIYFNQQWMDYTGLTLEESLGHGWNKPFHPDDQQVAWDAWQNATRNLADYSLESRLRRADGVYKWWLIRGVPVFNEQGSVAKWFGTCTDIDEFKKAEEERLSLEKQLLHAQKLESLGILAGGIAHDFNNILMAIIGNAELARMKLAPESPLVTNLQQIGQSAMRAADLAKQMLAYSGKGKFLIVNLDLNRLIEEIVPLLKVSISKKALLQLNLSPDLPSVEADATQIHQIIMNLVINASEAIGDESGLIIIKTGRVECTASNLKQLELNEKIDEGVYVYLEITDTGCGMDKETQNRIFDPFFTTKFSGRGLGMAAVHGIVRGHKGGINLYSEPGKGTTIRILLPAGGETAAIVGNVAGVEDWHGSGTVLLVDDEEIIRSVGAELLKVLGFTVVTAIDGDDAVEIFKARSDISCALLDLTMPRMDGEQCFQELRRINPDVRIVISSGYSEQEVAQRFLGKRVSGIIQKPYSFSGLQDVMKTVS